MPNWCYTKITFHGNIKEIEDFHKKLDEWTEEAYMPNGFGPNWLGNILYRVGLGDRVDAGKNGLRCRGQITYVDELDGISTDEETLFYIDTETAWCPMIKMWVEVIKALEYKTIGFSYLSEELGMGIYEIYDPYGDYDESYYVATYLDDEDQDNDKLCWLEDNIYHSSDEDLISTLQKVLDTDESNLETLIDKIEHYPFKSEDSYVHVHKYEIVKDLEDCI